MSAPSAGALRASEVRVRTTPLTCGCQASVAINIRISGIQSVADSLFPTLCQGYFKRVTSQTPWPSFLAICHAVFRAPRHLNETIPESDEAILAAARKRPETSARYCPSLTMHRTRAQAIKQGHQTGNVRC